MHVLSFFLILFCILALLWIVDEDFKMFFIGSLFLLGFIFVPPFRKWMFEKSEEVKKEG